MPTENAALLAEYMREPRHIRRAVSRDLARAHPVPPRPASDGTIGERVRTRRKMPHNVIHPIGGTGRPKSGQARINAKRNQRAAFWDDFKRTVRVSVSRDMEPYFRKHIKLLGSSARIGGRHPTDSVGFWLDLDVHLPDMPANAVGAMPLFRLVVQGDEHIAVPERVDWIGADGRHIEAATSA